MRLVLIGFAAVVALLTASVSPGEAQFSRRYCTQGGSSQSSGEPDCSYNTWEQCMASARGLARYCAENPFWKPEGSRDEKPQRRGKPRRN
jgi:Protein of unknown function (DUF3551)